MIPDCTACYFSLPITYLLFLKYYLSFLPLQPCIFKLHPQPSMYLNYTLHPLYSLFMILVGPFGTAFSFYLFNVAYYESPAWHFHLKWERFACHHLGTFLSAMSMLFLLTFFLLSFFFFSFFLHIPVRHLHVQLSNNKMKLFLHPLYP